MTANSPFQMQPFSEISPKLIGGEGGIRESGPIKIVTDWRKIHPFPSAFFFFIAS